MPRHPVARRELILYPDERRRLRSLFHPIREQMDRGVMNLFRRMSVAPLNHRIAKIFDLTENCVELVELILKMNLVLPTAGIRSPELVVIRADLRRIGSELRHIGTS